MNKKKWIASLILLLVSFATVWAIWFSGDPHMDKIKALREQMGNDQLTREQRGQLWGQMREEMSQLTPEQRNELFADRRKRFEERERERMNAFFAMPRDQQIAAINKRIDEEERRRKEREKRRAQNASNGGQNQGGNQNGQGQGGGRGGNRSSDPLQRRKDYLDNTSPANRAQNGEYRRMMHQQRTLRGLRT